MEPGTKEGLGKPGDEKRGWREILGALGPGLITGASDDDPSGIGTYAQAGAKFGYATLWTSVVTVPLAIAVQYICAKVALVSGFGLAGTLRERFPKVILWPAVAALLVANTINAGVDIGAVAAGFNLLVPGIPTLIFVVPVTLAILVLLVAGSYGLIDKIFKWLAFVLLAYVGAAIFSKPDFREVLKNTFIPNIQPNADFVLVLIALLGTTISPYLFFYQSQDEIETQISQGRRTLHSRKGASKHELHLASWDVSFGIVFSNIVMYFIVLATAATLHASGKTEVDSAAAAAEALKPIAGDAASLLFAIGIIGSGVLAIPILVASASYAVAEVMDWKRGLDEKPYRARRFYVVIGVSMVAGMLINFLGINPIDALFWTAVLNGFLAPPLLVLIMIVANDRKVMGKRVNNRLTNIMGWGTCLLMAGAALGWLALTLLGGGGK